MNIDDKKILAIAHQVLDYAEQLQSAVKVPEIPELFADDPKFIQYHENSIKLRDIVNAFAKGDLSVTISMKGFIAGACKALQANLRHMTWVVRQIEKGDYSQRIDFLGDFSKSFNNMAIKLKTIIDDLQQKEEALTALAVSLQEEAKKRSAALLELKNSEQRFKMLADYDSLTNLLNRRAFFSCAEMKVQNASFLKQQCCVCLLDVDHFKIFNDTFGHIEGDRALQHVAQICHRNLRLTDIMGRYGGEEFIILLSMGEEQSYETIERLRQAMEENPFLLENGETAPLTASFGIAVILPDEKNDYANKLRLAIAQADSALYIAKAGGRNRLYLAPPNTAKAEGGSPFCLTSPEEPTTPSSKAIKTV